MPWQLSGFQVATCCNYVRSKYIKTISTFFYLFLPFSPPVEPIASEVSAGRCFMTCLERLRSSSSNPQCQDANLNKTKREKAQSGSCLRTLLVGTLEAGSFWSWSTLAITTWTVQISEMLFTSGMTEDPRHVLEKKLPDWAIRVCAGNERNHNTSIDSSSLRKCSKSTRHKLAQMSLLFKTPLRSHPCTRTALKTWTTPCTSPCTASTLHSKHLAQHLVHPAQDPGDRMLRSSPPPSTQPMTRALWLAKRIQKNLKETTRMQKNPIESKIAKGAEGMANFGKLQSSTVVVCESQDHKARKSKGNSTICSPEISCLQWPLLFKSRDIGTHKALLIWTAERGTRTDKRTVGSQCHERRRCAGFASSAKKQRHKWLMCMFPWVHIGALFMPLSLLQAKYDQVTRCSFFRSLDIFIYTHIYIHMYIYIYVYVYVDHCIFELY